MGFEPTRGDPNGLAVHRLNHSATSSWIFSCEFYFMLSVYFLDETKQCLIKWSVLFLNKNILRKI